MVVSSCQTFWRMLLSGISYVYVQTAMVQFFFQCKLKWMEWSSECRNGMSVEGANEATIINTQKTHTLRKMNLNGYSYFVECDQILSAPSAFWTEGSCDKTGNGFAIMMKFKPIKAIPFQCEYKHLICLHLFGTHFWESVTVDEHFDHH